MLIPYKDKFVDFVRQAMEDVATTKASEKLDGIDVPEDLLPSSNKVKPHTQSSSTNKGPQMIAKTEASCHLNFH